MLAPMTRALRAVRRARGSAAVAASLVAALAGTLSGCAGIGQPAPYDSPGINGLVIPTPTIDAGDFVEVVDNPWLALEPGAEWTYDAVDAGRRVGSIEAAVLDGTTAVAGLAATGVTTTTDIEGARETATRYYAQDEDGNVWLVGVDADRPGGDVSWRAGQGGAQAGLAMPADPRLGDGWLTYDLPGLPRASTTIEQRSRDLVQARVAETGAPDDGTDDGTDDGGTDDGAGAATRTVYEKGVGLVSVEDLTAGWTAALRD